MTFYVVRIDRNACCCSVVSGITIIVVVSTFSLETSFYCCAIKAVVMWSESVEYHKQMVCFNRHFCIYNIVVLMHSKQECSVLVLIEICDERDS